MSYPSLLWKKMLSECPDPADDSEMIRKIPQNVLTDLGLEGELRPSALRVLRIPCTAEEIPMRQKLFAATIGSTVFAETLDTLRESTEELERLTGRIDRAQNEDERVLLFPAVLQTWFETADQWAALQGEENRFGEIGRHFASVLAEETAAECRKRLEELSGRRQSGLRLIIRGGQVYAAEGQNLRRVQLEEAFDRMGLGDDIVSARHPSFAPPSVIRAYAGVYSGYTEMLRGFFAEYRDFFFSGAHDLHEIAAYSAEISFLTETARYFEKLAENGYPLCYPECTHERLAELKDLRDPSLLRRQLSGEQVVPNDLFMASESGGEKLNFFILSGANGGGKTTFLRACGLAVLFFITGCPVAARRGRMYAFDCLYAHFPANENFENSGRFVNEAERADAILADATENSFALFNETYSGTDEKKSEEYSSRLAETLYSRGVFGIYVTHIHALTGGKIPTLAAVIDESDENRRTYKIRRVGGTKSSFAADILEKYGLDRTSLQKRLTVCGKEAKHG